MSENVNFNGKIVQANQPLFKADNRSLKYGDGLFETIRIFEGEATFFNYHFKRLKNSLLLLKFEVPEFYSPIFFKTEIKKLINGAGNHRVRITIFRSDGGFYTPFDNKPQFLIEAHKLHDSIFTLNEKGLKVSIFDDLRLAKNFLSPLKTCNSLPYVLAGVYCKEKGFDDCFLLNDSGNIAEGISSNLFIIKNKTIATPSLSESCIDGTMRKIIIEIARNNDFELSETSISSTDVKQADEVWLTNAIQGIKWVQNFEDSTFDNKIAKDFVHFLNRKITANNI